LESINYRENISAIDIGFGAGFPLIELAMRLGEGSIIYGIDPWKAAIERALEKISFYGIPNITLIEGVAESIPLENDSIDLIVSNNGINNVGNIDQVLGECSRILKKDGQYIRLAFLSSWKTFLPENRLEEIFDKIETRMNEAAGKAQGVTLTVPFAVIDAIKI
jgi:ubiquinone/menaquinone biosynthesis C-methylase UbiE